MTLKTSEKVFQSLMLYFLLPEFKIFLTLIIKPVDSVDGGALVVPPEHEKVLGIFDLVGQHQADRFD